MTDLYIAPDTDDVPTIWAPRPSAPSRPEMVANIETIDARLWDILARHIPTAGTDVEPGYWYAEGYSVGRYQTAAYTVADLATLRDADRTDYWAGHIAGGVAFIRNNTTTTP